MSQLIGVIIMAVSTFLLMKYLSALKKEMNKPGKEWWLVVLSEVFTGVSFLLIIGFLLGFLLVIKPFK